MQKITHILTTFFARITKKVTHNTLTTPQAIIVGAIIIAFGMMGYGYITTKNTTGGAVVNYFTGKPVDSSDYVEGDKDADVFVIEYSDPECPFCVQLFPTMKQLRTKYADRVGFVYRHFPLTEIHPHAFDESKAIACAGVLGGEKKFYEYMDALYGYKISNRTTQLPKTGKEDIARGIGLSVTDFTQCLQNQKVADVIGASINDGAGAGVQGTPATFVVKKSRRGYEVVAAIDGARGKEYFEAALEQALDR
jgi:protein-disulfide isomerase